MFEKAINFIFLTELYLYNLKYINNPLNNLKFKQARWFQINQ